MRIKALAYWLFGLFMLISVFTFAQKGKKKPVVMPRDSSAVQVRQFSDEAINTYSQSEDFKYIDPQTKQDLSLWDLFLAWVLNMLASEVGRSPLLLVILKYLILGLIAAGVIFLVLKAIGIDVGMFLRKGAKKTSLPYVESLENIHEINFDDELDEAVSNRNYRLAVRLLYLKCLKQLSDKGLIQWQIDKTNKAYYYELAQKPQRDAFGSLTRRFEYVWYGNFHIDEQAYNDIDQLFSKFREQL